jgi:hypothetical protein
MESPSGSSSSGVRSLEDPPPVVVRCARMSAGPALLVASGGTVSVATLSFLPQLRS